MARRGRAIDPLIGHQAGAGKRVYLLSEHFHIWKEAAEEANAAQINRSPPNAKTSLLQRSLKKDLWIVTERSICENVLSAPEGSKCHAFVAGYIYSKMQPWHRPRIIFIYQG